MYGWRIRARVAALSCPVFIVLGVTAPTDAGPDAFPEAEAYGARFVEAVNSNDDSLRGAVIREIFSPITLDEKGEPALLGLLSRLAETLGYLDFHHAEVSTLSLGETRRLSLHVFVRAGVDQRWRDLQFQLEADPPHRIRQLIFLADVAEPTYLPNGSIRDAHTLEWLNGYLDRLINSEDLSGALLIAHQDRPIFERYFGYADSARTVPCSPSTRFNLGSGDKMFTALGVAMLVHENLLRFDSTLDRFFPQFPDSAWARRATVGNLLSHTSGLGEYWTKETDQALTRITRTREVMPFVEQAGIAFAPGEGCAYSNSNFILAGLLIEVLTGQEYPDFIRERILAPCRMSETGAFRMDGTTPELATPLTGSPGAWRTARRGVRGTSAGGGFSTPRDILKFSRCLIDGDIVDRGMLAEMTRSHTAGIRGADMDYGYGFLRGSGPPGAAWFGHGGIATGVNFEYRYFPAGDITLIMFCNQDNGAFDSLRQSVTRLITGER